MNDLIGGILYTEAVRTWQKSFWALTELENTCIKLGLEPDYKAASKAHLDFSGKALELLTVRSVPKMLDMEHELLNSSVRAANAFVNLLQKGKEKGIDFERTLGEIIMVALLDVLRSRDLKVPGTEE
jgi:hypothetical protein